MDIRFPVTVEESNGKKYTTSNLVMALANANHVDGTVSIGIPNREKIELRLNFEEMLALLCMESANSVCDIASEDVENQKKESLLKGVTPAQVAKWLLERSIMLAGYCAVYWENEHTKVYDIASSNGSCFFLLSVHGKE